MRKFSILIGLILISVSLNAQLSNNHVIILNDLNKDQLEVCFKRARSTTITGTILTSLGIAVGGAGFYLAFSNDTNPKTKSAGELMYYLGGSTAIIGIPVLISGVKRKRDVEIIMMKYEGLVSAKGIGLKIKF